MLLAHHVAQAPVVERLQFLALGRAHMGGTFEGFRVPHVDVGGRNVEVASHHERVAGLGDRSDMDSELVEPAQLVLVVLVVERAAVGHVHRHHFHAAAVGGDDARLGIGLARREVGARIVETHLRHDGHAVPLALTEVRRVVSHLAESERWEHFVGHLRLLHQEHVGLHVVHPLLHARQPRFQRVHVPRGDQHATTVVVGRRVALVVRS